MDLSIREDLLRLYFFYSGILILKVILMSYYVGISRVFAKSVVSIEDVSAGDFLGKLTTRPHESVERKRRAHLNDLENIPFFILGSFLYIVTGPSIGVATWIFRIYTFSRIWHTFAYTILQSTFLRIAGFEVGMALNVYVVLKAILFFSS